MISILIRDKRRKGRHGGKGWEKRGRDESDIVTRLRKPGAGQGKALP